MSVELKVTLVGDDAQQQDAIENPNKYTNQPSPTESTTREPIAPPVQFEPTKPPVQNTEKQEQPRNELIPTDRPQPPEMPDWYVQPPPYQNQEERLIESIEELIDAVERLAGNLPEQSAEPTAISTERQPRANDTSIFERFASNVDRKIDEMGFANTSVGNLLSQIVHNLSSIGNRLEKAATTAGEFIIGGGTAESASAAATAATATRSAAAGAGAAATAESTGVAAAAEAAVGPVVALGIGAAAVGLSFKALVDSVERVASELEDLSPAIASVRAQQSVTMELARLDRAQRIGGEVSQIDQANARIQASMYEVQTKIYEILLKASPLVEGILDGVNLGVASIDVSLATLKQVIANFTPDPNDDKKAAKDLSNAMVRWIAALEEANATSTMQNNTGMDTMFQEFLAQPAGGQKPKAQRRGKGIIGP